MNQGDQRENCGKIRCAVLLPAKSEVVAQSKSSSEKDSGFIRVSPSIKGPWTTVRLNYAAPAACWRLGNNVVASEVRMMDGNRCVNIRSLVSVVNNTDYRLDLCLVSMVDSIPNIPIGELKPGDTLPVPLSGLKQSLSYVLKLKCVMRDGSGEYSWSSVVSRAKGPEVACELESEICISDLTETEHLLYCTSSGDNEKLWFCLNIQATEIAKDIRSDPIQDWTLVVRSPFSIANYLPFDAKYSVLEERTTCRHCGDVFRSGETVNVYNVDIRNPLYFALMPLGGWKSIDVGYETEPRFKNHLGTQIFVPFFLFHFVYLLGLLNLVGICPNISPKWCPSEENCPNTF